MIAQSVILLALSIKVLGILLSTQLTGFIDELDIGRIKHARWSPRQDPGSLEELQASILEKGLLQPIVVRPMVDAKGFEIIAGNRRFEACKNLGSRTISAHIVEMNDKEAYEISLIENIQRKT